MSSPPAARPWSNAGTPAPPARQVSLVDVRTGGLLLKQVSRGAAGQLVARGWGEWRGAGRRRHIELTAEAPVSSLHGWGGKDGTRPMRADGTGLRATGQVLGEQRSHLEHR